MAMTIILQELVRHAHAHGFRSLFLTTTSAQAAALKLYHKMGWTQEKVRTDTILSALPSTFDGAH